MEYLPSFPGTALRLLTKSTCSPFRPHQRYTLCTSTSQRKSPTLCTASTSKPWATGVARLRTLGRRKLPSVAERASAPRSLRFASRRGALPRIETGTGERQVGPTKALQLLRSATSTATYCLAALAVEPSRLPLNFHDSVGHFGELFRRVSSA